MYMAPELIVGRWFDGRSDLFSFGLVLLEMLTGRHPCAGQNPMDAARRMMQGQIPRPPRTGSPIRDGLADVAMRCLMPQAEKRFPDAGAVRDALSRSIGTRSRLGMRRALSEQARKLSSFHHEHSTQIVAVPILEPEAPSVSEERVAPRALQTGDFEVITIPGGPVASRPARRRWIRELAVALGDEIAMIWRRLLGR